MTWQAKARVFMFTVVCVLSVSSLISAVVVVLSEPHNVSSSFFLANIAQLIGISLVAPLPLGLIGALIGATIAIIVASRSESGLSRWTWVRRGSIWGVAVATSIPVSIFIAVRLVKFDPEAWSLLAALAP